MILIHPPVVKPSEPPAGIACLSGALHRHGIRHSVLDANLEGLLYLLEHECTRAYTAADRWTRRAVRHRPENILSLRSPATYTRFDSYKKTVLELNRALRSCPEPDTVSVGLANYEDRELSPLRSGDLLRAAEDPGRNPFFPYFGERLRSVIEKEQPAVAGFSLNYLSQALCTFAMAGFVRKHFPTVRIVLGGGLVTSWMKRPNWRNPFGGLVDLLVAGPGERPLLSLLGADDGEREFTPDYSLLPVHEYFAPGAVLPYSASRGCYWHRCSFCPEEAEGNPYTPVAPDRVVSDLRHLAGQADYRSVHFLDNAMSVALMKTLSGAGEGLPWYGFARITRELTDLDFCAELKRSGCVMLKLGLESGDQGVLDGMQKGVEIATASQALRTLKKAGIATYIYLLFGTPWETETSARKTLGFVASHSDAIGFLNLAVFNMPLCGKEAGLETRSFYDADLSLYTDFRHPEGWDRKQVRSFLENEFKKQRDISAILRKDPPLFTSNHAPFFVMGQG